MVTGSRQGVTEFGLQATSSPSPFRGRPDTRVCHHWVASSRVSEVTTVSVGAPPGEEPLTP